MKEYTITMAKKRDLENYYAGATFVYMNPIEIEVEANTEEEAIKMAEGYKRMTVWKVNGKAIW